MKTQHVKMKFCTDNPDKLKMITRIILHLTEHNYSLDITEQDATVTIAAGRLFRPGKTLCHRFSQTIDRTKHRIRALYHQTIEQL